MDTLFAESVETARRLARTCGPQTSKDAAEKMVKSGKLAEQEAEVYDAILRYDTYGFPDFTTKDIAVWLSSVNYDKANVICGKRFSGLRNKDKIELTGDRRDGCRVWRLK